MQPSHQKNHQKTLPKRVDSQGFMQSIWIKAIAYVLPQIGITLILTPIAVVLAGIYAKYYGLTLTAIAAVMLAARFFDAVTDPLIGYYSDRWRERTGSRKLFILVGGCALVPCSYFLYLAPESVSITYFCFWYMALYLAYTVFNISYIAWAHEFTANTQEKTLVFSLFSMASQTGSGLFYLIPLLPFFISSEINPEILKVSVFSGIGVLSLGMVVALNIVPDGIKAVSENRAAMAERPHKDQATLGLSMRSKIAESLSPFINNRPFIFFVAGTFFISLALGMWFGLFFIYVDSYLRLGEEFAKISLWGMICGILAVPIWYRLVLFWGKKKAWLVGMFLFVGILMSTSLLQPGNTGLYGPLALKIAVTFALASYTVIANPMFCDVIDYGRLKDPVERTALYFSVRSFLAKAEAAMGGAVGLAIVGWFDFDVKALEQTEQGVLGLLVGISWMPALCICLAIAFIALMPLTEKRMDIIRRRLKQRDERAIRDQKTQRVSNGELNVSSNNTMPANI
jgi:Na+/melibiose symporter-like transporter